MQNTVLKPYIFIILNAIKTNFIESPPKTMAVFYIEISVPFISFFDVMVQLS